MQSESDLNVVKQKGRRVLREEPAKVTKHIECVYAVAYAAVESKFAPFIAHRQVGQGRSSAHVLIVLAPFYHLLMKIELNIDGATCKLRTDCWRALAHIDALLESVFR